MLKTWKSLPFSCLYRNKFNFSSALTKQHQYCFSSETFTVDPHIEHYAEIIRRAGRRKFLNEAVLNQNKLVIYAELRQPSDKIFSLKKEGKCPGVIERISGNR